MFTLTRNLAVLLLALTSTFATALTLTTPDQKKDTRDFKLEHYKWYGETPKAKLVRVINPFGAISTRNTSYDNIEISGAIQKIGKTPAQHKIDITDNNGVTEVVVSYPNGNKNAQGQLTGRFDLGVWVPAWVNVEMVTDFGDIKAKKHSSNLSATTTSGKIKIASSGTVDAQSDTGDIKVDFYGERFKQPMNVSSNTGDVKVNLSQKAKVTLRAASNNPIKHNLNDYQSIKVSDADEHHFKAELAKNSTDLQLSSEQGQLVVIVAKKASYKTKIGQRLSVHKPINTKTTKTTTATPKIAPGKTATGKVAAAQ